jgi:hypothetical protein
MNNHRIIVFTKKAFDMKIDYFLKNRNYKWVNIYKYVKKVVVKHLENEPLESHTIDKEGNKR